jgi:putative transposase
MLIYKANWYGREVKRIDRFYPSSKTCSHCGNIKQNLTLNDRVYKCEVCGRELDRDYNASLNILRVGTNQPDLKLVEKDTIVSSMKQEIKA